MKNRRPPRPTVKELAAAHDRLQERMAKVETGSREYHRLYGAYKALLFSLGYDCMTGGPFSEWIEKDGKPT